MTIGLATYHTGYSFGTYLQAYAMQKLLHEYDDNVEIFAMKSLIRGRNIHIKKIASIFFATVFDRNLFRSTYRSYIKVVPTLSPDAKEMFANFRRNCLNVKTLSYRDMTVLAKDNTYSFFVCGSDQIWNASSAFMDPIYYLRFAPEHKRVAYAASMGNNQVLKKNLAKFRKYVSEIPHISVREHESVALIESLTGRKCQFVLDPTLMFDNIFWRALAEPISHTTLKQIPSKPFALAMFLDEPVEQIRKAVQMLTSKLNLTMVSIRYDLSQYDATTSFVDAGPLEFLQLLERAEYIVTDSYHGVCFAINYQKPFAVFPRNYTGNINQGMRIKNLLNLLSLSDRYYTPTSIDGLVDDIDYTEVIRRLNIERNTSRKYLNESLRKDVVAL